MLWRLKARLSYWLARKLFHWPWCVRQPRIWRWMEGQFARMANLGSTSAQSFYGHILAFRGQGMGAREEGVRLLRLAALSGDAKAAYQVGVFSLAGTLSKTPDAAEAARWWTMAAKAGHPLAGHKLAVLYQQGGPGLMADPQMARLYR
ncbi:MULTISPECIES: tetratricopeptide repeat protein [Pseudomonas]|uniref:FOG: TPR repeat, SEL1 subfamily n=3 Tax=Pseudomonas TaxID=286 RepID=A0A267C1W9_PSEFR|nr:MULTISPECIES: SEL1-like repeat protein [Pseudomonas]MCH4882468.1 sel1 repeat family protein [Pseudomonas sp. TMW22080]MQT84893.1 sel1 repeat family protein [Pseudomonas sp. FSL R10-2964]MQU53822.1 sel1 repeat family protein [Pseudomonas sp. FSL R10-1339]NMY55593.1 sel1 repeat family protein [Pseudomonas sp. WS 5051]MBO4969448.1 sel1 repeat family protein [Pseudomonas sp.]